MDKEFFVGQSVKYLYPHSERHRYNGSIGVVTGKVYEEYDQRCRYNIEWTSGPIKEEILSGLSAYDHRTRWSPSVLTEEEVFFQYDPAQAGDKDDDI